MKIFFDHQTFSLQDYGGISRYFVELIDGINQTSTNEAYLSLLFTDNVYISEKQGKKRSLIKESDFYRKKSIQYRLNKIYCYYELARTKFDVFHATYYDPYFTDVIKDKPFVVTFLDMIHERLANKFVDLSGDNKITKRKRNIAEKASAIIAISESTKNDIVELFDINPNKISVIHLGSSLKLDSLDNIDHEMPYHKDFLLFVGNRGHYKNFIWFLKAVTPVLIKYKLKLICAGGGPFSLQENKLIDSLRIKDLVLQQPITDRILINLYYNATAFIFPSLYEGFGIPVLEAFACDCPCIVSNRSSLPEVAGDAALYIDPEDPESLIDVLESILTDSLLRETLVIKGRERLMKFSWTNTVQETLDLYSKI
ncbi:glycosyltransferase family 4 protein [Spirosoma sp. RP8]|uniref:Glycosyltransferase family 4 protein n=1 Tax=Spirosoma liriopis TaxID=2937440 RepID=A0ABT0HJF8_9BACT|nr:glycosyltransferase family 1 protein [Spirosoma liriopis]MCK8492300.1 glycosyltransferase family 4 protein [Spirosoma liriopis]